MTESLLTMAKDLTVAQIQAGQVPLDEMNTVINTTFEKLSELKTHELPEGSGPTLVPRSDWKKSITKYAVRCLECGTTFKELSGRHLQMHNLDGRSYRQKYGIPRTQSLTARDVSARRRDIVKEHRPWEKANRHRKGKKAPSPKRQRRTQTAS